QMHHAILTETGSSQSLTVDGTLIGTLAGTPQPGDTTYDQLGTGFTNGWPAAAPFFDPFVGTINQIQITNGTALAGSLTFPASGNGQVTFTPPNLGAYTVGLSANDKDGGTGTAQA